MRFLFVVSLKTRLHATVLDVIGGNHAAIIVMAIKSMRRANWGERDCRPFHNHHVTAGAVIVIISVAVEIDFLGVDEIRRGRD